MTAMIATAALMTVMMGVWQEHSYVMDGVQLALKPKPYGELGWRVVYWLKAPS